MAGERPRAWRNDMEPADRDALAYLIAFVGQTCGRGFTLHEPWEHPASLPAMTLRGSINDLVPGYLPMTLMGRVYGRRGVGIFADLRYVPGPAPDASIGHAKAALSLLDGIALDYGATFFEFVPPHLVLPPIRQNAAFFGITISLSAWWFSEEWA